MGLYGGFDVDDIHTKKGLEVGQKIFDYMGSTELIANLFRISQTEEKLRKDEVDNAKMATSVQGTERNNQYFRMMGKQLSHGVNAVAFLVLKRGRQKEKLLFG